MRYCVGPGWFCPHLDTGIRTRKGLEIIMVKLVVVRHGQSLWNLANRFTGWVDVDLSDNGVAEAKKAGKLLAAEGIVFHGAFTSVLKRAIRTLWIILDETDLMWVPIHCSWRLNERHYGALQGRDKAQTAEAYGKEQVHAWRRSYAISPPPLSDPDVKAMRNDPRYAGLEKSELPQSESLKDTLERVLPYWHQIIVPELRKQRNLIISAHGNSIRALVKHLDGISDSDIVGLEIPTGVPLVYDLDADLHPIKSGYLE